MSLFESLDSSGKVSLESLFSYPDQDVFDPNQDFTIQDLSYLICRGGWPLSLAVTDRQSALEVTKTILIRCLLLARATIQNTAIGKPILFGWF